MVRAGSIKGRVVFEGTPPVPEKIAVKTDMAICGSHQMVEKVVVGDTGGIRFAVVRLVAGKGVFPKAKVEEARLDQVKCQFEPHVQIVPVGSKLVISSSDDVLHNAHGFSEDGKTVFNIAVPVKGMKVPVELNKPGRLKLRCDAGHSWMSGYVIVSEHPCYAVTDATGSFELKDVPAGMYTIEIWQESLGVLQQKVTVKADGTEEVQFTYRAKPSSAVK